MHGMTKESNFNVIYVIPPVIICLVPPGYFRLPRKVAQKLCLLFEDYLAEIGTFAEKKFLFQGGVKRLCCEGSCLMTEAVKDQENRGGKSERTEPTKDEHSREKDIEQLEVRRINSSETGENTEQNSSLENSGIINNDNVQTVDEFKNLMYKMQETRRTIVVALLNERDLKKDDVALLRQAYERLTDSQTHSFQREMCTLTTKLSLNIRDETRGLEKDLKYLETLSQIREEEPSLSWPVVMSRIDLISILADYHPEGKETFMKEYKEAVKFLRTFIGSEMTNGKKPIFVTDWDGTMKDYCSQYATNLQPIYSAIGMVRFADRFTRISAVLTAGPLRGPGILDLTAMPIDGPVMFSGSWGREWWLSGKRVVHEDGITDEGFNALQRLDDEMKDLLHSSDYAPFALVGSGVQRKVDRLTLGVQTVCHHIASELSNKYQMAVKERVHRVDPNSQAELEVEVVAHSSGIIWNKADGVDRLIKSLGDSLKTPGKVLICGDTPSDLPMVRQAAKQNPEGVMAIFVGAKIPLREEVKQVVGDDNRCCFVSCPDIIHAAMSQILNEQCIGERSASENSGKDHKVVET
uniref:Trehalose-6-phosphate phosphatase helical bundle domain-containing protein n=1 Tax=Setaria digitata TaxID=48799 RepID=A0A915PXY7_9BILA